MILYSHPFLQNNRLLILLMMISVPAAGELKIYPFSEAFRIGLGPPVMFFFLLFLKKEFILRAGFLTASAVLLFRTGIDLVMFHHESILLSLLRHFPAFIYYFLYAYLFDRLGIKRYRDRSIAVGFSVLSIDLFSNAAELFIDYLLFAITFSFGDVLEIFFIALVRSFIVLSFLNMLKLNEAHAREKHITEQNEHMLMLVSNLYEETVYLKKTLNDAEEATRESYQLYRSFKQMDSRASQQALKLAGKIHEIKKDNQRIFAGLSNVIIKESPKDFMSVQELVQLTVRINEKYAISLGKNIIFSFVVSGDHPPYHVYTFLSLINNLVSNAVEAIEEAGSVRIELIHSRELIELHVFNSGRPISEKYKHLIFDPGFTTKYDKQGNPSTGIGLAHVKELINSLNGDITVVNERDGVLFVIKLPMHELIQKG